MEANRPRPEGAYGDRCFGVTISLTEAELNDLEELADFLEMRRSHVCYEMIRDALLNNQSFGRNWK